MNEDPTIEATTFVPPPFPVWPPPSGGAPFPGTELGPITNPYPYGSPQPANISTVQPPPPFNGIKYPQSAGIGKNGQNQPQHLPPDNRPWETGPLKASPSISQIQPPPIMGPGSTGS
jgi:hypothetical protein